MQRRFLSILAETLPPTTMGSGWRGSGAVANYTFIIHCYGDGDALLSLPDRMMHSLSG
ncbi:MAG: hypothetical protein OEY25_02925 [Candidatus Aminicenantes bacterium]|nr:hypothetical protein [Candidatus Aminicenantes bacterium]